MSISTRNIKPESISTTEYVAKHTFGERYGEFKYGARKYGASTANSSGGQKMPLVNTKVL